MNSVFRTSKELYSCKQVIFDSFPVQFLLKVTLIIWGTILILFFVAAVVISLYEEPIQPQQAASVVEKLGDYLVNCGY